MDIDSCKVETQHHIERVREILRFFTNQLTERGVSHDASKLQPGEIELFAEHTDTLSELEYGSEEYKEALEKLKPALEHHYANNKHHPEYYPNQVAGMSLIDIMEMLADWKASSERTKNGNLLHSIQTNINRFNIEPQLAQILINTAKILDERGI